MGLNDWLNIVGEIRRKTQQSRDRGKLFQFDKEYLQNLTTNIILNSERLDSFPLRSGTRQRCPPSPLLLNTVWEVLTNEMKQKKRNKLYTGWEGISKTAFVLRWDDGFCNKSQRINKTPLEIKSEYSKFAVYKVIYKIQLLSYILPMSKKF